MAGGVGVITVPAYDGGSIPLSFFVSTGLFATVYTLPSSVPLFLGGTSSHLWLLLEPRPVCRVLIKYCIYFVGSGLLWFQGEVRVHVAPVRDFSFEHKQVVEPGGIEICSDLNTADVF